MKTIKQILLLCLLWTVGISASAYDIYVDGIYYDITSSTSPYTVAVTHKSYSGDIIIPSKVTYNNTTYSVTSISSLAFDGCSGLTSVTIPNSVTKIGTCAFQSCSGLTRVDITDLAAWCNISFADGSANPCLHAHHLYLNNEEITDLVIPNSVTSIGSNAFRGCSGLTSITIPNSVTSIGRYAFDGCSGLTSISIPNSVTSIEYFAFDGCNSLPVIDNIRYADTYLVEAIDKTLSTYNIKEGTKWIGYCAFSGCSGLTSVTIPNSVTSIEDRTFSGCKGLTNIAIPNSVTSIGDEAFYECSGLTNVVIPNSVTSIGTAAFCQCLGITSITIPNSVTEIGASAFLIGDWPASESLVKSITLNWENPQIVTIGNNAFYKRNTSTCVLYVPKGTVELYRAASVWSEFTNIQEYSPTIFATSISLDNESATIEVGETTTLTATVLPEDATDKSVTWSSSNKEVATVSDGVVTAVAVGTATITASTNDGSNLSATCKVTVDSDVSPAIDFADSNVKAICLANWDTDNNGKLSEAEAAAVTSIGTVFKDNTNILSFNELKYFTGLTTINEYAFSNCTNLTSFAIPNSVTSIGTDAFKCCSNLTSVTIPNSVTSIGQGVFYQCKGLKNITIPNSVTFIGNGALGYCTNLTTVTIPNSVTSIECNAFIGCTSLTSVSIPNSVTSIEDRTFSGCKGLTNIAIPNSVTSIGVSAFSGCSGLTSITIPNSVTSIGEWAFSGCSGFTSISIPNSVTEIGNYAFDGCNSLPVIDNIRYADTYLVEAIDKTLSTYNIKEGTKWIGANAFRNSSLMIITIPNSVTSIGAYSFYDSSLTSVTIPNSVTTIEYRAFSDCSYLTSVAIDNSVVEIGKYAFQSCSALTSITLGNSVTSLGMCAFYGCSGLTSVSIPNSVTFIEDGAFYGCSGLTSVTANWDTPMKIPSLVFLGIDKSACVLYVPKGTVELYRAASVWSEFTNIQEYSPTILTTSITIDQASVSLEIGETTTLTATVLPEDATDKSVTWTSSNEEVATVSDGVVTAVTVGTATITATTNDGSEMSASCDITVIKPSTGDIEPTTDITQYDNVLYFEDMEKRAGEHTFELQMNCAEENITAFQCDVYLPDGVEWASTLDKRGNTIYTLPTFNEDRTDTEYHTINAIKKMSSGAYRVIVYSMSNEYILETSGTILSIPVVISDDIEAGDYNIFLKDMVLTDVDAQQTLIEKVVSKLTIPSYVPGDANGDDLINVTDIVTIISYMMENNPEPFIFDAADVNEDGTINVTDIVGVINIMTADAAPAAKALFCNHSAKTTYSGVSTLTITPFNIDKGTTSATVPLNLLNPGDEFTAFECKIYLPEGIDWAHTVDKRGNVKYTLPTFNAEVERTDATYHTINTIKKMEDGGFYVIVYSGTNEIFLDEEGAILDLPLTFDEDLANGVYDIRIGDMVISRTNTTDVKPDDYTCSVLVGQPEVAHIALHGDFNAEGIGALNDVLDSNTSISSVDLSEAMNIDSEVEITSANKNLIIVVPDGMSVANTKNVVAEQVCDNLELTDGYNFNAPIEFTATAVSYERAMANSWGTICLPYAVSSNEQYQFYEFKEVSSNSFMFETVSGLAANEPGVFKKLSGSSVDMSAENVLIAVTTDDLSSETGAANFTINGCFRQQAFADNDPDAAEGKFYIKGDKFLRANGSFTIPAFRAYFTATGLSTGAKEFGIGGEETGVSYVGNVENAENVGNIYNLSGQKLESLQQGVNIVNGVKIIVK